MEKTVIGPLQTPAILRWPWLPGFVLLCWWLALRHLFTEWTLNEQYQYGWVVPLLTLYLIRIRLESVPATDARPTGTWWLWLLIIPVSVAEMLLLPVQESNPDWRLLGWVLTGLAVLVTLAGFYLIGGWAWTRHFLFPVLFFFTAVPWPKPLETPVMQDLMQLQARFGAELLSWCGVIAEARGNVIATAEGVLGVDEACSGIRSLQASLMVALFIGEVFGLGPGRRTTFLMLGAIWALLTNTARTMTLAWMAGNAGTASVERWHDPVGHSVLAICLIGLAVLGWLLRPGTARRPRRPQNRISVAAFRFPLRFQLATGPALAGVLLIAIGGVGTQWWFAQHERNLDPPLEWTFEPPSGQPRFERIELSSRLRGELRYDAAGAYQWSEGRDRLWVAQYFRWEPRKASSRIVADHDPRACLAATGKEFVSTLPSVTFTKGPLEIVFDSYWFRDQGRDVFVYNSITEDMPWKKPQASSWFQMISHRLDATLSGRRNLGLRRLEIAAWNATSPEEAEKSLLQLLSSQISQSM